MNVYSAWLQTDAPSDQISDFVETVGASRPSPQVGKGVRLFVRQLDFSDAHQSGWQTSHTKGSWFIAIAELPAENERDGRLVGVLSGTSMLTSELIARLEEILGGAETERATFSLSKLLNGPDTTRFGLQPRSVRLQTGHMGVLLQANDVDQLRKSTAGFSGEPAGVTVQANDQRVTVLEDGQMIFSEAASLAEILAAVQSIEAAATGPTAVGA